MAAWVDFKKLREGLDFVKVLDFFGAKLSPKGEQLVGFCPLPNHNGKGNSPSFSAHAERGIFQCFGCGAKGNVLDFAVLMRNGDPENGNDVRKTALELQNRFGPRADSPPPPKEPEKPAPSAKPSNVVVNQPLDFRLKDLDPDHPYLLGRGFTKETIRRFELGFCSRGLFKDRVVIPLHNPEGRMIGYAGRVVDDAMVNKDNPRYLLPGKREHDGVLHEFRKGLFLYNGHRIRKPVEHLVIVEGFTAVWWLAQHGYPNVVALMGSTFTMEQIDLIHSLITLDGHVWIMADGDAAGYRCGGLLAVELAKGAYTRLVTMAADVQPTDLSPELLQEALPFGSVEMAHAAEDNPAN